MSAQRALRTDELGDAEMLDADTSAALIQWMETAVVPDGIDPNGWEQWVDSGCSGRIDAHGVLVTPAVERQDN